MTRLRQGWKTWTVHRKTCSCVSTRSSISSDTKWTRKLRPIRTSMPMSSVIRKSALQSSRLSKHWWRGSTRSESIAFKASLMTSRNRFSSSKVTRLCSRSTRRSWSRWETCASIFLKLTSTTRRFKRISSFCSKTRKRLWCFKTWWNSYRRNWPRLSTRLIWKTWTSKRSLLLSETLKRA